MSTPKYDAVLIEDAIHIADLRKKGIVILVTYDDAWGRTQVVTYGREASQKIIAAATGDLVAHHLANSAQIQVNKDFRSAVEAAENKAEVDRLKKINGDLLAACKALLSSPKYGNEPSDEAVEMAGIAIRKAIEEGGAA